MRRRPMADFTRNYVNATYDPETREPLCVAFFAIRSTEAEAAEVADALGIHLRPWLKPGEWCAIWEIMPQEVEEPWVKVTEFLTKVGLAEMDFFYIRKIIPELPGEAHETNCYESLEQALEAIDGLAAA